MCSKGWSHHAWIRAADVCVCACVCVRVCVCVCTVCKQGQGCATCAQALHRFLAPGAGICICGRATGVCVSFMRVQQVRFCESVCKGRATARLVCMHATRAGAKPCCCAAGLLELIQAHLLKAYEPVGVLCVSWSVCVCVCECEPVL